MKFKVLEGMHVEDHPTEKDAKGKPIDKVYARGEVVDSKVDLVARFGSNKFQRLWEEERKQQENKPQGQGEKAGDKAAATK